MLKWLILLNGSFEVPNVPCGVERGENGFEKRLLLVFPFLMCRVELKGEPGKPYWVVVDGS